VTQTNYLAEPQVERFILGCMMIDDTIRADIQDMLNASDFYVEHNRWIFEAICSMEGQIDAYLLCSALKDAGRYWDDPDYIAKLALHVPSTLNWMVYTNRVKVLARKRALVELAAKLAKRAHDPQQEPSDLVVGALKQLSEWMESPVGKWLIFTLKDALEKREPIDYIIEGILALPSLNILYGAPGCLKSFLMLDAALCVAAGLPWLEPLEGDSFAHPTMAVPVLWLDFDNGSIVTHERVAALARTYGIGAPVQFYYVSMPSPWLDGKNMASVDSLIELAKTYCSGLIVIDNLGTVSGGVEENASAMIQVMSNFRQLAESTGAAVVLIHHQRKATGYKGRTGESLRGHSSIEAALDLALLVQRDDHEPTVTIQSTKTRGVDVPPFGAMFTYDHVPGVTQLHKARFFGFAVEDDRRRPRARRAILEAVADVDLEPGKTKLVERVRSAEKGLGINYVRDAIDALVEAGELVEEVGDRGSKRYILAE